jgi:hypothetical protein
MYSLPPPIPRLLAPLTSLLAKAWKFIIHVYVPVLLLFAVSLHVAILLRQYDYALFQQRNNDDLDFLQPATTIVPPCTLATYRQYFKFQFFEFQFSEFDYPFDMDCLLTLIDEHPLDLTLRVGLVRKKYDQLQASGPKRHIVYYCETACGGVGDRIRAALNTFYLALAMNSTFAIDMELPVRWKQLFRGLSTTYDTGGLHSRFKLLGGALLKEQLRNHSHLEYAGGPHNWDEIYSNHTWYSEANVEEELFGSYPGDKEVVILSGLTFRMELFKQNSHANHFFRNFRLNDLGRAERSYIFSRIFMPNKSEHLRNATRSFKNQMKGTFVVGMHIGLGGLGGENESIKGVMEEHRSGISKDPPGDGPACIQCMVEKAKELCKTSPLTCTVLLSSDIGTAVKEVQAAFTNDPVVVVLLSTGEVMHLGKSYFIQTGDILKTNATKSFVDWQVMAEYSDVFVISRSGFGEHASWYNVQDNGHFRPAFQFKAEDPCEFDDFRGLQNRYSKTEY